MITIFEKQRETPVIADVDICVLGGSCTGVFAAVRAARLGAKVAIVEKQNAFGGAATSGLVNLWHKLYDTIGENQIIAGLTQEVIERLTKRDAVKQFHHSNNAYCLNTEELKIELDELISKAGVLPFLHSMFVSPCVEDDILTAVMIENKSGRGAIKAKVFIDATGDGDLCHRLDMPNYVNENIQPPTFCAKFFGSSVLQDKDMQDLVTKHREEFGLVEDWGWRAPFPGVDDITMNAETHVFNVNCADANQLTYSEIEGRRQVRAILDIIKKYGPENAKGTLIDLAAYIGIRETRHIECEYKMMSQELLAGTKYHDAVINGTYPVDIHLNDKPGIIIRHLDGTEDYIRSGFPTEKKRWREEGIPEPHFYQVPFRSLIPKGSKNVLLCGRMLDAERGAFGALRVMVNLNQMGEAAGVAAYIAINENYYVNKINTDILRKTLKDGGSAII